MKTYLLSFFFLLFFLHSGAQNFRLVTALTTKYYVAGDNNATVTAIGIDTAYTEAGDTVYGMVNNYLPGERQCDGGSLFGSFITKKSDTLWEILTSEWKLYINPNMVVGQSMEMYSHDTIKIICYADSIRTGTVFNIPHKVKSFHLQKTNLQGKPIPGAGNDWKIRISDVFGLYEIFDLYYMLSIKSEPFYQYSFIGDDSISAGFHPMTAKEIFNFNVGDVFHYSYSYQYGPLYHSNYYRRDTIISKYESANKDTLKYQVRELKNGYSYNHPRYDTIYSYSTKTVTYILPVYTSLTIKPMQGGLGNWDAAINSYRLNTIYAGGENLQSDDSYRRVNDCYEEWIGSCVYNISSYAKNLGVVSTVVGCGNETMVYYRKGNETWGVALGANTGIAEPFLDNLNVYPNPCSDKLVIACPSFTGGQPIVTIFDLLGRAVYHSSLDSPIKEINTSGLPEGNYFLKIFSDNGLMVNKVFNVIHSR